MDTWKLVRGNGDNSFADLYDILVGIPAIEIHSVCYTFLFSHLNSLGLISKGN